MTIRPRPSSGQVPPIFYGSFGGVAFLLLAVAVFLFARDQRKMQHYVSTPGAVIDNNYRGGYAVVEYEWRGERKEYTTSASSRPPAYDIGERVEVLVNPADPSDVTLNSLIERFLAILILSGLGAVFLGFTLLFYYLSGK
jgi:hypothetical protein